MTRVIPFLTGLVAALIVFAVTGAQAEATGQTLGIVMQRNSAATERLPYYRMATPIAVSVRGDAVRFSDITVTAHAPDGSTITTPLVRTGNAFTGALTLAQAGTWTVALRTRLGSVSAALADVPLDVVADDNADLAARLAYALSALSIGAGLTLLLRGRRVPVRA